MESGEQLPSDIHSSTDNTDGQHVPEAAERTEEESAIPVSVEADDTLEHSSDIDTTPQTFARQEDLDRILSRLPEGCSDQEQTDINEAVWSVVHSRGEQQMQLSFDHLRALVQYANDRRRSGTSLERRRAAQLGTPLSPTTPSQYAQAERVNPGAEHDVNEERDAHIKERMGRAIELALRIERDHGRRYSRPLSNEAFISLAAKVYDELKE